MAKRKRNYNMERICHNCEECIYVGEGGYICGVDYQHVVIDDWAPTDDFLWCGGKHFVTI